MTLDPTSTTPSLHLIAALVTPFTPTGTVDAGSLSRLLDYLAEAGVTEYFLAGSTGESPLLDEAERLALVSHARAAAPRARLYAGITGTGHRQAIRLARQVAEAGADVVVLMSPYFIALSQEQLVDYCVRVADESPRPLTVYHHLRMPTPFLPETVAKLASHPNIAGIKDTSGGDHDRCAEIRVATAGRDFRFFQGVEKLTLSSLAAGADGCVLAQACIAPRLFRALFDAWHAGDHAQATRLQDRVTTLWSIFLQPEVRQSFLHFLLTLKRPLVQRGVIDRADFALPGVTFDPAYESLIDTFMREHPDLAPTAATPGRSSPANS